MQNTPQYTKYPWSAGKQWFVSTWGLLKKHYGIIFGCMMITICLGGVASTVPFIGYFLSSIIDGATYMGLCYIIHRALADEKSNVQDVFICFQSRRDAWGQGIILALYHLLFGFIFVLLTAVVILIVIGPAQSMEIFKGASPGTLIVNWPLFALIEGVLFLLLVAVIVSLSYFAYPLIFFQQKSARDAMSLSNKAFWANTWPLTSFGLIAFGLIFAGLLCLLVGALLVLPWLYTAYMKSYQDIFGIPEIEQHPTFTSPDSWIPGEENTSNA